MSGRDGIVETAFGCVRGEVCEDLIVFRGVPYALPPVGARRFGAPVPAERWRGVRDATVFGPAPPQTMGAPPLPAGRWADPDDWLSVNVWMPARRRRRLLPVLFWIYGGAYKFGASSDPRFDGGRIAREHNAVVVSCNYRVGVEGFAHIENRPDNRGLRDLIAALRWVNQTIDSFGGDARHVTIWGQSAGGGCVAALMASPLATGLFHRAIIMSVPRTFVTRSLARAVTNLVAAGAGCEATSTGFEAMQPARLANAGERNLEELRRLTASLGPIAQTPSLYAPVIDDDVVPDVPWKTLRSGTARDIPLIAGHTKNEYRLFMSMAGQLDGVSDTDVEEALRLFAPSHDVRSYRGVFAGASPETLLELVKSDWLFRMPSVALAVNHTRGGGTSYLYEMTFASPDSPRIGAAHGVDVPLVFGTHRTQGAHDAGRDAEAERVGAEMRAAFGSFANGNDPGWAAIDADRRPAKIFDVPSRIVAYPEQRSLELARRETFVALTLPAASD